MNNAVRLIGGQWRGRKISVAEEAGLRPTLNRVRETLFNWLMHDIVGARCLDAFSGTGALGLEALSRGANFVSFVEKNPKVMAAIAANCSMLKANAFELLTQDVLRYLSRPPVEPFQIIFLDPPFRSDLLPAALQAIEAGKFLAEDGLIYFECESTLSLKDHIVDWEIWRHQRAGQSQYGLLIKS
jgi:16S rRNA (guanine966-N2)-methyltransferase